MTKLASPNENGIDAAILVGQREWRAFWKSAGRPAGKKDEQSGRYIYPFKAKSANGQPYRCVALDVGESGPEHAASAASVLLQQGPATIVALGTAVTIHDDLNPYDVLVADQVDGYLNTVRVRDRPHKEGYELDLCGQVYRTTHGLVQEINSLEFSHPPLFERWRSACRRAAEEMPMRSTPKLVDPSVASGHLASGPVFSESDAFSDRIRQRDASLRALELGASGMMLAAHCQTAPTSTLVLMGILKASDPKSLKDHRSNEDTAMRHLAMLNATELLWTLIRGGLLPRKGALRGKPSSMFHNITIITVIIGGGGLSYATGKEHPHVFYALRLAGVWLSAILFAALRRSQAPWGLSPKPEHLPVLFGTMRISRAVGVIALTSCIFMLFASC